MLHNIDEWNSKPSEVRPILERLSKGASFRNNQLNKNVKGKKPPYVKHSVITDIMIDGHRHVGHLSPKRKFKFIAKNSYWESKYLDNVIFISKCTEFSSKKLATTHTLYQINLPRFAFHTIINDIVCLFPTNNKKTDFYL